MGEKTGIAWCDHTFNPWIGCTKVSAGCEHCYAEAEADKRYGLVQWGPNGQRRRTKTWRDPIAWDREAAASGVRRRVFCASWADVFEDRPELEDWRRELFDMIYDLRSLDWLLVTKRPEFAYQWIGGSSGAGLDEFPQHFPHVWLGTSIENQQAAEERIPHLLEIPAAVRFVSLEPLIGPVNLTRICCTADQANTFNALDEYDGDPICRREKNHRVDWVIVGGESGSNARPCNIEWIRSIVEQCQKAGVPVFVKQLGSRPTCTIGTGHQHPDWITAVEVKHPKGGDPAEWPEDLRVREFPISDGEA